MTRAVTIGVLLLAAVFEAGGDALVRTGIHADSKWQRALLFVAGAVVLFAYGWTVNAPPWDFGKVIGIYVVFFFIIAQLISWLVFKQPPSLMVMLGGLMIVGGGVVIAFASA
jgi:drug/metabolite transporter superfamily protein YnfA